MQYTVESCVCLGSVLMGTHEEELLRRHKGLDYWVEQIVQVLAGFFAICTDASQFSAIGCS